MRIPLLRATVLALPLFIAAAPDNDSPTTSPASTPSTQPAHDRDPWIFRCVLDGNPRIVVVSLGDHHWAAYDAAHCALEKFWEGDVELVGAVYDMRHGPQPKSKGKVLLERPSTITVRSETDSNAANTTRPTPPPNSADENVTYRGYTTKAGVATFHFEHTGIQIGETPTVLTKENGVTVLRRTFTIDRAGEENKGPSVFISLPTSDSVAEIRLVEGAMTQGIFSSQIFRAPQAIPFAANENKVLAAIGPKLVIDTVFNPADQQPANAAK